MSNTHIDTYTLQPQTFKFNSHPQTQANFFTPLHTMSETWDDYIPEEDEKKEYSADTSGFGLQSYYIGASASNENVPFDDSLFHDKHTAQPSSRFSDWIAEPVKQPSSRFGGWLDEPVEQPSSRFSWEDNGGYEMQSEDPALTTTDHNDFGRRFGGWLDKPVEQQSSRFGGWLDMPIEQQSSDYDWVTSFTADEDVVASCECYWPACSESFSNEDLLKGHISSVHVENDFMCGYCDQEFSTSQGLKCHLDRFHPYNGANPLLKRMW